jgi:hypothetical protein
MQRFLLVGILIGAFAFMPALTINPAQAANAYFRTQQYINCYSVGLSWTGIYNYNSGLWEFSSWNTGYYAIPVNIPWNAWKTLAMYDYVYGLYTEMIHLYDVQLQP